MEITALIDNKTFRQINLPSNQIKPQHGISYYIETTNHKIIFDTGCDDQFIKNAKTLGINLELVDIVIISHGHADHTGGLLSFLKINNTAKIYIRHQATNKKALKIGPFRLNIGVDSRLFDKVQIAWVDKKLFAIDEELTLVSNPETLYKLPSGNKRLFHYDGQWAHDPFADEQSLIIKNCKTTLVTGCSHRGILNILESAKKITEIDYVIGGFHLIHATYSNAELNQFAQNLSKQNIKFYTGHCTGGYYSKLKSLYHDLEYLATGQTIKL